MAQSKVWHVTGVTVSNVLNVESALNTLDAAGHTIVSILPVISSKLNDSIIIVSTTVH